MFRNMGLVAVFMSGQTGVLRKGLAAARSRGGLRLRRPVAPVREPEAASRTVSRPNERRSG